MDKPIPVMRLSSRPTTLVKVQSYKGSITMIHVRVYCSLAAELKALDPFQNVCSKLLIFRCLPMAWFYS